nr:MAG TPA: hypothetical protein [Caudoviricetes sp.]
MRPVQIRDFIYTLYSTQENRSLIIPIINH